MSAGSRYTYLAFPPRRFSRLQGPWPSAQAAPSIVDVSRQHQEEMKKEGVGRWYKRTTGKTTPRPKNEHKVAPFGAARLELTAKEAVSFRREFPQMTLVRNAPIRVAARAAATAAGAPAMRHLNQTGVAAARAAGWASSGEGVTVAIVDSGIDSSHPEFAGKVILSMSFDEGGNATGPVSAPSGPHATHLAGLVAGQTAGLAPAAGLFDVQAFFNGETTPPQLSSALFFAAASNAQVINLSGGFLNNVPFLDSAVAQIAEAGKLLVCATGNTSGQVACPANFDSPLSVGAVDDSFVVTPNSGSGTIETPSGTVALPEVVAPGVDVFSSLPGGGFGTMSGTSQAAAIVTGMAALRISDRNGNLSLADLIAQLLTHTKSASPASAAGRGCVFYNRI